MRVDPLPLGDHLNGLHLDGGDPASAIAVVPPAAGAGGVAALAVTVAVAGGGRLLLAGQFVTHGLSTGCERVRNLAMESIEVAMQQALIELQFDMAAGGKRAVL